jgi:hypothetical protein
MNFPRFTADHSLYAARNYPPQRRMIKNIGSAIEPQLPIGGGSGGGSCTDQYQSCYIDCSVQYPESADSVNNLNAMYREACYDSCDAAYRLCGGSLSLGAGRVGWAGGRLAPIAARSAR